MTDKTSQPVAIVTGAARNIGREIALALARDGAAVLVNARSDRDGVEETAAMVRGMGGSSLAHLADVTDEAAVGAMIETTAARLGPPTILVNNAALRRQKALVDMALADWREIMTVNLDAAFLTVRACLPHMIAAGGGRAGGRIVNIGGKSAHAGAAERAHVVASKAGLVGLFPGGGGNLVGRRGLPEEVARVVAMLCRSESAYITGQTLHVNGGGYLP
jgi:3-oxoacyl-[acyl-carrier protein] reductase